MARKRPDPKEESLRAARALNPRPEAVADADSPPSEFLDARDLVQVNYEMVRRVRVEGEPVSAAAAEASGSPGRAGTPRPRRCRRGRPARAAAGPARAPPGPQAHRGDRAVFGRGARGRPGAPSAGVGTPGRGVVRDVGPSPFDRASPGAARRPKS